ncbi:MAG: vanadium-dependent haloperoxidase [Bacteroidota bacterium]|nr:vanadium-dependent haloperoxidase [Bacteroidota bacterium]
MKRFILGLCILASLQACKNSTEYKTYLHDPMLFTNTVHELNDVVMGNNFPPMVAARNYTYGAIAAYEIMVAAHPDQYQTLAGQLHGLNELPKPEANQPIDYELSALLAYIKVGESVTFPEGSMQKYKDSILQVARDKGLPKDIEQASQKFADTVSAVIISWSKKDNYLETRGAEKYTINEKDPSRWVPTPPGYFSATEPHWAEIRTLVLDSAKQFFAPVPFKFNVTDKNSDYYKQVISIKNAVDSLTDEQKHIADFWDDNAFKMNVTGHVMFGSKKFSPSGHWMSITGIAAKVTKADYPTTVYAFAKTAIALFDAFIQCWGVKYTYNTVRPETVINKYFDANWRPYLQTPAFPEYTCGHCTISASAAEALTSVFGDNIAYTDSTELEFGIKNRSYSSFRDAAKENIRGRFYGGIHYEPSNKIAHELGTKVGAYIVGKLKMKK